VRGTPRSAPSILRPLTGDCARARCARTFDRTVQFFFLGILAVHPPLPRTPGGHPLLIHRGRVFPRDPGVVPSAWSPGALRGHENPSEDPGGFGGDRVRSKRRSGGPASGRIPGGALLFSCFPAHSRESQHPLDLRGVPAPGERPGSDRRFAQTSSHLIFF
jgi:hypothetical protein